MKKVEMTMIMLIAVLMLALGSIGCTDETKGENNSSIANDYAATVVNEQQKSESEVILASSEKVKELVDSVEKDLFTPNGSEITDILIVGQKVYSTFEEGVMVYDLMTNDNYVVESDEGLNALAFYLGDVYVGGNGLYKVKEKILEPVDLQLTGVITDLCPYEYRLVIGTECGLHANSIFGHEVLFDDIKVSAITTSSDGLWVGTDGQGLYKWDGREFNRRFLRRDTTIFDYVQALDFNHGHLYVGTSNALYSYNGGSWKTFTTEDGLPSDDIRAIDASNWIVYIGTEKGVASFFNEEFKVIDKLSGYAASSLGINEKSLFVGTAREGLLKKTGPVVKVLKKTLPSPSEPVALTDN